MLFLFSIFEMLQNTFGACVSLFATYSIAAVEKSFVFFLLDVIDNFHNF